MSTMLSTLARLLVSLVAFLHTVSCATSETATCSEDVNTPPKTVLDRLCLAWRWQFNLYDVNRNWILDRSDLEYITRRTLPFVRITARDHVVTMNTYIWRQLVHSRDIDTTVFYKDFLQEMVNLYQNNKPLLTKFWSRIFRWHLKVVDFDGDQVMSKEEMMVSSRIFGASTLLVADSLPLSLEELWAQYFKTTTETGMPRFYGIEPPSFFISQYMGFPNTSKEYMQSLRQQWSKAFDINDVNHNGKLERSDLYELKSRSRPFIPEAAHGQMGNLQDLYWTKLIQSDELDNVRSKEAFLRMIARQYQAEYTAHEHDKSIMMKYFEQGFVDTNGDLSISSDEMEVAAFIFRQNDSQVKNLQLNKAKEFVIQAKKTEMVSKDLVGDVMEAMIGG